MGEKPQTQAMSQTISGDTTALKNWLSSGGTREQITRTVYDEAYPQGIISGYVTQLNLRNRVSYVQAIDVDNTNIPPYRTATFYSYDVHGNADTVLHDYGANSVMGLAGNQFKLIRYDYDLISGKVNMVSYQPHNADGYYQQYKYDGESRLASVWTSRDSILWQQDATYRYYRHGPLARTELGDLKVQGVDYAYTLEGALKGINSTSVGDGTFDMGEDGKANSSYSYVPRDAFGMSFEYYTGDYIPISIGITPFASANVGGNLYNGNIKTSIVNIPSLGNALAYAYQYDQLNRLTGMDAYTGLNNSNNTFNPTTNGDYRERLTYDPNGNILSYLRNGAGNNQGLNNYSYTYATNKNQLQSIFNSVTQQTKTYAYDLVGNVTDDGMQGVQSGQWDLYNRVQSLQNKDGKTVTYTYDMFGHRISKIVGSITEWYVRTTDGNILATYVQGDNAKNNGALTQTEVHLYGSSELGIVNSSVNCTNLIKPLQTVFTRAEKTYQLTDYRQNVMAVVSDKRIQQSANNTTVDYSMADIISANYYSTYGAVSKTLPTPTLNGFNGQRRSSEISATAQTAQFWEYNADVGRRWNIDPIYKNSPYSTFGENPIAYNDPNGLDTITITHTTSFDQRLVRKPLYSSGKMDNYPSKITDPGDNGMRNNVTIDIKAADGADVFKINEVNTTIDKNGKESTHSTLTQLKLNDRYMDAGHNMDGYQDDRFALAAYAPSWLLGYYANKNRGWDRFAIQAAITYQSDVPFVSGLNKAMNIAYTIEGVYGAIEFGLSRLAFETAEGEYINLASAQRTVHIIQGDATGGGHAWFGSFKSFSNGLITDKSMFPASWSNAKIMNAVSDVVVNNPWIQKTGKLGAAFTKSGDPVRYMVEGMYEGTKIRAITTSTDIITAFPIK